MVILASTGRDGLVCDAARITRTVVKKGPQKGQVDLRRGTLIGRHFDGDVCVVVGEGYQGVSDIN